MEAGETAGGAYERAAAAVSAGGQCAGAAGQILKIWERLTGEYKKIEPDCREGVRVRLERNNLYEKQNDLKGQKQKIEKSLEQK